MDNILNFVHVMWYNDRLKDKSQYISPAVQDCSLIS
jgi:hypothetical protein